MPVITAGRMENPEPASDAISKGQTDMIALGRPLLADSEIPNKILADEYDKVRPCLSCQEGCMGRLSTGSTPRILNIDDFKKIINAFLDSPITGEYILIT